jgi:Kef-type K+ transport system membrane component KefB
MNDVLLLLITVGVAVVLSELSKWLRLIHTSWSAILLIALGFACGPHAFGLFDTTSLLRFDILLSLLIGLVGFILGIELRHSLNSKNYSLGVVLSGSTIVAVGATVFTIFCAYWFPGLGNESSIVLLFIPALESLNIDAVNVISNHIWLGLAIGTAMVCASMYTNASLARVFKARGPAVSILNSVSTQFESLAVFAFGLALAASRALSSSSDLGLSITDWGVIAISSGVLCGILFALFIGKEMESSTLFLASIGVIIFSSGLGKVLGISPLFVNLIFGFTVALFSNQSIKINKELGRLIKPLSTLIFFFAGANWSIDLAALVAFAPLYLVLRYYLFKAMPQFFFSRVLPPEESSRSNMGLAIWSQDFVAITLALAFQQRFPLEGHFVLSIVIVGMLASQIVGPVYLRRWLVDQGSVSLKG